MLVSLRPQSILQKIKLIFILLFTLQIVLLTTLSLYKYKNIIESNEIEKINYIISNKVLSIENTISSNQNNILKYATSQPFVNLLKNQKTPSPKEKANIDNIISNFMLEYKNSSAFFLIDNNSNIVATNYLFNNLVGTKINLPNIHFIKTQDFYYSLLPNILPTQQNMKNFLISKRVLDPNNGATIGYIIAYIDTVGFLQIFNDSSFLNNYLILISPSNTDKILFKNDNKQLKLNYEMEQDILKQLALKINKSGILNIYIKNNLNKLNIYSTSPETIPWDITFIITNNLSMGGINKSIITRFAIVAIISLICYLIFSYFINIYFKNPISKISKNLSMLNTGNLTHSFIPLGENEIGGLQNQIISLNKAFNTYYEYIKTNYNQVFNKLQDNIAYLDRNSSDYHLFQQKLNNFAEVYTIFIQECDDFKETLDLLSHTYLDNISKNSQQKSTLISKALALLNTRKLNLENWQEQYSKQEAMFRNLNEHTDGIGIQLEQYQEIYQIFNNINNTLQKQIEPLVSLSHNGSLNAISIEGNIDNIQKSPEKIIVLASQMKDIANSCENFFLNWKKESMILDDTIQNFDFINKGLEGHKIAQAKLVQDGCATNNTLNIAYLKQFSNIDNTANIIENINEINNETLSHIDKLSDIGNKEIAAIKKLDKSIAVLKDLNRNDIKNNLNRTIDNINVIKQKHKEIIILIQEINNANSNFNHYTYYKNEG